MSEKRRRRRYSKDFKRRVVAETFAPGSSVAAVSRRHGLNANMVFTWRRDPLFRQGGEAGVFLPVEVSESHVRDLTLSDPAVLEQRVEIELRTGHRLIFVGAADAAFVLRLARGLAQA